MRKLSLFSGIGGDDLASDWAGIETICFVEIDNFCQQILKKHWPNTPIIGDIDNVTKEKVKELTGQNTVDIIAGGDPCQPRSSTGKRRGRDDDRDLWKHMFKVLCEFKPPWIVNENPTGRLTMDFHEVLSDLEGIGYEARSFVIPACAVNAPHRRDRLFIIAHIKSIEWDTPRLSGGEKQENPRFRKPYKNEDGAACWEENWVDVATRLCRVDDGIANRVDRIRACGNACIPQQVYPIYKAIVEMESYE